MYNHGAADDDPFEGVGLNAGTGDRRLRAPQPAYFNDTVPIGPFVPGPHAPRNYIPRLGTDRAARRQFRGRDAQRHEIGLATPVTPDTFVPPTPAGLAAQQVTDGLTAQQQAAQVAQVQAGVQAGVQAAQVAQAVAQALNSSTFSETTTRNLGSEILDNGNAITLCTIVGTQTMNPSMQ